MNEGKRHQQQIEEKYEKYKLRSQYSPLIKKILFCRQ